MTDGAYNAGCIDGYRYRVRAHDPEEISLRSSKTQTALKPSLIVKPCDETALIQLAHDSFIH